MAAGQAKRPPLPPAPLVEGIPRRLRDRDRWVPVRGTWEYQSDHERWKLKKRPLRRDGRQASHRKPNDWWSFEKAHEKVEELLRREIPAMLFYVIDPGDGLVYGDLDHVGGRVPAELDGVGYVEQSGSGTGLRVILEGRPPFRGAAKNNAAGTRAMHAEGYISITGHHLDGCGDIVADQGTIDALFDAWGLGQWDRERVVAEPAEGVGLAWDPDEHQHALDQLDPDCDHDSWIAVGQALHAGGADVGVWDEWSAGCEARYPGPDEVARRWASFGDGRGRTLGTLLDMARAAGWDEGAQAVDQFEVLEDPGERPEAGPADSADPSPGYWAKLATPFDRMVEPAPPREWAWDQWVPYGVVTGLAGPPGVAKSTLALQLCMHHVLGDAFLDAGMGQGPAVFITVEDDEHELRRRVGNIAAGMFMEPADFAGLTIVPAVNARTDLVHVDPRSGQLSATSRLKDLRKWLRGLGARLVVLDLVGDFWDGNENARAEVAGFVRSYLGRLAVQLDCAVLVVSHLNKQGQVSGSTAWLGSYRSALVMDRPNGHVELRRVKANYAPPMDEPARVRWDEGYIRAVPVEELEGEDEDQLLAHRAAVPVDVWHGVMALRGFWGVTQPQVHTIAATMEERGWLERRQHGGNPQWRA